MDPLLISVRCRDELDGRPCERRHLEEDVDRVRRQPGEAAAEQLLQALGHRQGTARRRPRVRAHELASELEREERIARRRLLHAGELGPRQLQPESLLEQAMDGCQAERAEGEPLEPRLREGALELEGLSSVGPGLTVASSPIGSSRRRRSAICSTPAEAGSSHCASSIATSTGPARPARAARRARQVRSHAGPAAASPGSASSSAISSARRRGGASEGPRVLEHSAEQIGQPGEGERCLGLDAAAGQDAAEALASLLDARLPEDRLADPGLAREHERARTAARRRARNARIAPSSSSRPMISGATLISVCGRRIQRRRKSCCKASAADAELAVNA